MEQDQNKSALRDDFEDFAESRIGKRIGNCDGITYKTRQEAEDRSKWIAIQKDQWGFTFKGNYTGVHNQNLQPLA